MARPTGALIHIEKQFVTLLKDVKRLEKREHRDETGWGDYAANARHTTEVERLWTQGQHLVKRVCGKDSIHCQRLRELAEDREPLTKLAELNGVLDAARRDFEAGMFEDIRRLVRADVLDHFLSQAEELHTSGFNEASVSLGGAVLEDTLRKLCDKHSVPYTKKKTAIEALNVSLVKAQVYDGLVQKRITHLAQLRNDADHGRSLGKVKPADAEDMLRWLRRFVTDYLNQYK